jgi:hypothetical protein
MGELPLPAAHLPLPPGAAEGLYVYTATSRGRPRSAWCTGPAVPAAVKVDASLFKS